MPRRSPALPPGPATPALIQALRQRRDPISFASEIRDQYGDVFTVAVPIFGKVVYATSPETVEAILTAPPARLQNGALMATMLAPLVGPTSVATLDGDKHLHQRKLLLPLFHGESVQRSGDILHEMTMRQMRSWPLRQPFALQPHISRVMLAAILKSVFGVHDMDQLDRVEELFRKCQERYGILHAVMPAMRRSVGRFSPWARFLRANEAVDSFVYELIDAKQTAAPEDPGAATDLLSLLVQARHVDGSSLTRTEVRDELVGIIHAGHETSTVALCWTFERLLRTPRALARLRESVAAGEDEYLAATVKEALRIRPPLMALVREIVEPLELSGFELPAGTRVLPSVTALHFNEDLFPDPLEFRPERFLDGKTKSYSWIPFGGGTRRCLGASFAEFEMREILRTVISHADLSVPDQRAEKIEFRSLVLAPARAAEVIMDRPLY